MNATAQDVNATTPLLPPEQAQPAIWPLIVFAVFVAIAVSLCLITAIQNFRRRRQKRTDYEEIESLVV